MNTQLYAYRQRFTDTGKKGVWISILMPIVLGVTYMLLMEELLNYERDLGTMGAGMYVITLYGAVLVSAVLSIIGPIMAFIGREYIPMPYTPEAQQG